MISLSSPKVLGKEKEYINECLQSGWISTSGPFIEKFENELSKYVGAEHVVCCINGTAALQISLKLIGVKENDEVIDQLVKNLDDETALTNAVQQNLLVMDQAFWAQIAARADASDDTVERAQLVKASETAMKLMEDLMLRPR